MRPTLNARSSESARQRLKLSRELFAELLTSFQDFHDWIGKTLETSSPGSQDAPLFSSQQSPSQT